MKQLDNDMWVAGQIAPEDVAGLAARGVTGIVNNRPDGEEPGQPTSAQVGAAAAAAGLAYTHIPMAGGLSSDLVEAMAKAIEPPGRVLAFCKSGTRSVFLWALARARMGDDPQELHAKAADAGYDLSPISRYMQSH